MGTTRTLTILAALALTAVSCGGSDSAGAGDAPSDASPGAVTATTAPEDREGNAAPSGTAPATSAETAPATAPSTSAPPPSTAAPAVDDGWAEQLVAAFTEYDEERERLDAQTSSDLGELPPDATEQDFFSVLATLDRGLADAGDRLLGAIPDAVPADVEPAYRSTIESFEALVLQRRAAADGLDAGDVSTENLVEPLIQEFAVACAELQFVVLNLGHGFLPCGIPNERFGDIPGVDSPTTDENGDNAATVELPPGDHVFDYLDLVIEDLVNNAIDIDELPLRVELSSDRPLTVTSSRHLLVLAVPDDGPSLRVHTNGYVADPTRLQPDEVPSYWPTPDGPGAWTGVLEGVTVDSTGTGRIAGVDGEYWELTSERDDPIAILGDEQGGVPDTVLEPGDTIRLWWIVIRDGSLLITEHAAPGMTLAEADTDLVALRTGLSITAP